MKLHRDALMGMCRSRGCLPAVQRQAGSSHSTSLLRPRHALRDGNLARIQAPTAAPPDLLFLQAFPQAAFAPDAEALAESNLKGFANTSMVLIETNIHQSAPCSESTSSAKDHVSPAGSDTVPQQQCQSRLATGSLLPALPEPRPPSQAAHGRDGTTLPEGKGGPEGSCRAREDTPSPKRPLRYEHSHQGRQWGGRSLGGTKQSSSVFPLIPAWAAKLHVCETTAQARKRRAGP